MTLSKTFLASSSSSWVFLYLGLKCWSTSFFAWLWLAMSPASFAVRCMNSSALSLRSDACGASQISMSALFASV